MAEKKSFVMYKSWSPLVEPMDDAQAGKLLKAIFAYQRTGEEPPKDAAYFPMFNLFKEKFMEDQEAYDGECERNRNNGMKGGRPKKTETNRSKPTETQNNPVGFGKTDNNPQKPDKDKDTEKDKDTDTEKEKPKRTQASLVGESSLSDPVKEKLMEWLAYKKERREGYKETGLRSLITEVGRHERESGSTAVINLINECMANGWRGIIWDKLKPTARSGTTRSELDAWANA